jgi:hypothetical protein
MVLSMNELEVVKQDLEKVANRLANMNHPRSADITRIAQYFGNMMPMQTIPTSQFASEEEEEAPESAGLNPGISSYVKPRQDGEQTVDNRKTHTCTVIFKAPDGVTEAEMMNYILGIGQELGVDVESFKWSKSEAKITKIV